MRYTKEMYERNMGKISYGRIMSWDNSRGYGFIRTEGKTDIFLSSYNINKKDAKKLVVGALVSFLPDMYNGKYVATEVSVVEQYPEGDKFVLPNGTEIDVKHVTTFRFKRNEDGEPCIFFYMHKNGVYTLCEQDARKTNDMFDIEKYMGYLKRRMFKIRPEKCVVLGIHA